MSIFNGSGIHFINDSIASFNAWASTIHNSLIGSGWTQTADTGQIDLTNAGNTLSNQGGASNGYQIFQPSDSLTTFFLKIEYGSQAQSANAAGLWISVGTSTDGAGNLTGNVSFRQTFGCQTYGTDQFYASGGADRFSWAGFASGGYVFGFGVSRTRDANFNPTSEGVSLMGFGNSFRGQQYFPLTPGSSAFPPTGYTNGFMSAAPTVGTGSCPPNIGIFPAFVYRGFADNPDGNFICYFTQDIPPFDTVTVPFGGTNHNYLALQAINYASINGNNAANSFLMRYE